MTAPDRVSTPGFRVLVVDDDPDMQRLLALMIRTEGMQADTADDGDAALARASAAPAPDLILLDVMLPGIDGFTVCERLKHDPATAMIPIVLITALEDRASRVRGIRAGADDFLSKPVQREELLARVQTLRRLHETRRELEENRKETLRKTFDRYLSPRLVGSIMADLESGISPFERTPQRVEVVVLFAD